MDATAFVSKVRGEWRVATLACLAVEVEIAEGEVAIPQLVQRAATEVFDALGTFAMSENGIFNHQRRNALSISLHNPVVYKTRSVRSFAVNMYGPS